MTYSYVKALHIIFIVTWFSGLFYIVRLFIYFAETTGKPDGEREILQRQYKIMQKRLWYGITWPSAILTLIFGSWMFYLLGYLPSWLAVKLVFVLFLYIYHFICHYIFRQQQQDIVTYSSNQLRIWNEVATVFLIGIVFLVVLKSTLSMLWGLAGLVGISILLLIAIKLYRKRREKRSL